MKTKYYFFAILLVLSSCTGSISPVMMADYDDMLPIQDVIKSDTAVRNFIYTFKMDVESHNWVYVLSHFDQDNFKVQKSLGIDTVQYISEGMGLNYFDNLLEPRVNDDSKYSKLNNIILLDYRVYKKEGNVIYIYGYAKMYSGEDKRFELRCIKDKNRLVIAPPVG